MNATPHDLIAPTPDLGFDPALFDQLDHAIDHTEWTPRVSQQGTHVASGFPVYAPGDTPHAAEGFHIQAQVQASFEHALAYFHDACHFADTANAMTSASEILAVGSDDLHAYRAVVRTGFRLPWPLADREFLHGVFTRTSRNAQGQRTAHIVYTSLANAEAFGPAWPGYVRCPMRPSGQRITELSPGLLVAEHCMTYDLGGTIPSWLQNRLFHTGHLVAYRDEWIAAMQRLTHEARQGPALTTGRPVRRLA